MSNVDIKVIEIVGSFVILAVFIVLFALVGSIDVIKQWSNFGYVAVFIAFIVAMCIFGMKLAPRLSH